MEGVRDAEGGLANAKKFVPLRFPKRGHIRGGG